jgi:hypothetical protein
LTHPFVRVDYNPLNSCTMKGENMSHEEIWDDSALQNSWEDALEEYKV